MSASSGLSEVKVTATLSDEGKATAHRSSVGLARRCVRMEGSAESPIRHIDGDTGDSVASAWLCEIASVILLHKIWTQRCWSAGTISQAMIRSRYPHEDTGSMLRELIK